MTVEEALELLEIVDDYDAGGGHGPSRCVHTYRQGAGGILVGAHWRLEQVEEAIAEYGVEPAGANAVAMGHALVLNDDKGAVFLATKDQ